ncbi:hypothetical protein PEDI_17060 [Persicobacter diffluens]|uniref:Uncharacterized protein n=1 Tax=Persicobacter diffluens TaxID=981 RepID=A0AAN4VW29_9BACT|nr:hypothetical protein PEDI_17060 [Persicobacter diffluens]
MTLRPLIKAGLLEWEKTTECITRSTPKRIRENLCNSRLNILTTRTALENRFSFFLDKKRNKKIKAVINVGGPRNLLTESIKATFGEDGKLVNCYRNVAVMPSCRQQNPWLSAH